MSSCENENDTSKANINAPVIERTIFDWSVNTDKTITQVLYCNYNGSPTSLVCAWKTASHDQQYYTYLSPGRIHKIEDHNIDIDSEVDVDKSKAKVLNPPFVARTIGDWSSNLSTNDPTRLSYYQNNRTGETIWEPPLGFEDDQVFDEYRTSIGRLQITSEDGELEVARKQLAIAKEQATAARTYEQSIQQLMDNMQEQLVRPARNKTYFANDKVERAERELVATENRLKGVDGSILQDELWIRSFSYLTESDLFTLGQVSRKFLSISSADELWKPICLRRWKKKQNVKRFMKKYPSRGCGRQEYITEVLSYTKCFTRRDDPPMEFPALNMRLDGLFGIHSHISLTKKNHSWKESHIIAILDSRRKTISKEEILHFQWKEIHNGRPGQMVQFLEDGTYTSPVHGECRWVLYEGRMYFGQNMERNGNNWEWRLLVGRDANNWGWIIGKGQETMYRSAS